MVPVGGKTWPPRGLGIFPYIAIVKPCQHSRSLIYCTIIMKLCQKICPNYNLDRLEIGSSCLKNMATSGRGIFPYMGFVNLHETLPVYLFK